MNKQHQMSGVTVSRGMVAWYYVALIVSALIYAAILCLAVYMYVERGGKQYQIFMVTLASLNGLAAAGMVLKKSMSGIFWGIGPVALILLAGKDLGFGTPLSEIDFILMLLFFSAPAIFLLSQFPYLRSMRRNYDRGTTRSPQWSGIITKLRCRLFGHAWDGCTCSMCAETRNQQHMWVNDKSCTERCKGCGVTRTTHQFDGCRCARCGASRNFGHDLDWCKCKICGEIIDGQWGQNHKWNRCTCEICGKKRYADYGTYCDYHRIEGTDLEICSVCGGKNKIHPYRDPFTDDSKDWQKNS